MRYLINDDDFEEWIEKLEEVYKSLDGVLLFSKKSTLEYVIEQMKVELGQHLK